MSFIDTETPPPAEMPADLKTAYTMGGEIPVVPLYFNQKATHASTFRMSAYERVFAALRDGTFNYYGATGRQLQAAIEKFPIAGKEAIVFGAIDVNCDALALHAGASKVFIIEYSVNIEHPSVEGLTVAQARARHLTADVAFSISSFEHEGLGRYGDPLDPDGDLRAMREARELLKPGGILFLAVPVGRDCVVWNAHRIYGPRRLPKLLEGWTVEATLGHDAQRDFNRPLGKFDQPVFVLRAPISETSTRSTDRGGKSVHNIAFLARYFTSSVGGLHGSSTGSPNDHHQGTKRYSFCTDVETDPFIHFRLPCSVRVQSVVVRLRDDYGKDVLPLEVVVRNDQEAWRLVGVIDSPEAQHRFPVCSSIDQLRVRRLGHGNLHLSGVDILVEKADLSGMAESLRERSELLLIHVPFYGLGGQLAVCASALESARRAGIANVQLNGPAADVLLYPPRFWCTSRVRTLIEDSFAPSTSRYFIGGPEHAKAKSISSWRDDGMADSQERPVVLISRDNLSIGKRPEESQLEYSQRLYSRISIDDHVTELIYAIEKRLNFKEQVYSRALGVHLRHGNGELYHNRATQQWGVKPPSVPDVVAEIRAAIVGANIDIVIVASDLPIAPSVLSEHLNGLRVVGISGCLQETGAGCSHSPLVFDKNLPRRIHEPRDMNTHAMAEILILARCAKLYGGKSFFFEAVKGFSRITERDLRELDNNGDRYIKLEDSRVPICDSTLSGSEEILTALKKQAICLNGLFIRSMSNTTNVATERLFGLSFFDRDLLVGDPEKISLQLQNEQFQRLLCELRWYV